MGLLIWLIDLAFSIYIWIIIIQVAVSWLIAFEVINASNPQAQNLIRLMQKATDPLYQPLRKFIPAIGGIDITPIILILGLSVLQNIVIGFLAGMM